MGYADVAIKGQTLIARLAKRELSVPDVVTILPDAVFVAR